MSKPNFAWDRAPLEASSMTVFPSPFALHPDRLFPADRETRDIARRLYASVAKLPIISPHGHTDPQWFADDAPFPDPARLFIVPDHYVHRMLHSQGVRLEDLGVPRIDGGPVETDPRRIWRRFAENFHLFRGTPSWLWLNHAFTEVFGFHERLGAGNFDLAYDHIAACLERPEFRPRALFERFNIGLDHDGEPARRPSPSPQDEVERLERPGAHRLPSRPGRRPRLPSLPREPQGTRAHRRLRRLDLRRLSRRASQAARLFQVGRLHLDRPRPPERADRGPAKERSGRALRPRPRRRRLGGRRRAFPRADADRDGGHEPPGRARDADPSRIGARPQPRGLPRLRQGQGLRYPFPDRLCVRTEAAARPFRQ